MTESILTENKSRKMSIGGGKIAIYHLAGNKSAFFFFIFFVFSIFSVFFVFHISSAFASPAEKSPAEKFQEALQYANSQTNAIVIEKDDAKKGFFKVGSFKLEPEKTFISIDPKTKDQKSWYTDSPTQTNYYDSVNQGNIQGIEKEAIAETTKDENYKDTHGNPIPSPAKSVISGFQTRPIYKVTKNDDYITKGNQVIKNAKDIIVGNLDSDIKCKDGKVKQENCESTYEQKTCNEEIRTIKRICEKVPQVTFIDDPYLGCQRHTSPPSIEDCLAGEIQIPHYSGTGYGRIVIPKNRGARVGFSDSRHPYYYITATNETTGEVVIPRRQVSNGYYIELTASKAQDQTFYFVVERWDGCYCNQPGRMNIYINYLRKIPKIDWKEELCHDI